ncbi:hypothetical protein AXW37_10805 [Yersinia ruckeri]|nr:hypothetical protein AXW19_10605 [Yersinia ruckeri]OIX33981.1 hypothetical protein AXW20_10635 [Yersinia ruckeri]OIX42712.1 hypothetical protein AXW22_10825 [Yersinia ruckeri]OIX44602.1 hypothetical protein AXW21_10645 [Yersinia ruckeri]OIX44955.1 hypothetical protein AXW23_10615 [Yersinia ruckeri]
MISIYRFLDSKLILHSRTPYFYREISMFREVSKFLSICCNYQIRDAMYFKIVANVKTASEIIWLKKKWMLNDRRHGF